MLTHATEYYSGLFGPETEHNIHIDPSLWDEVEKVSIEDNLMLCSPFSENEIKDALFHMEKIKLLDQIRSLLSFINHTGI